MHPWKFPDVKLWDLIWFLAENIYNGIVLQVHYYPWLYTRMSKCSQAHRWTRFACYEIKRCLQKNIFFALAEKWRCAFTSCCTSKWLIQFNPHSYNFSATFLCFQHFISPTTFASKVTIMYERHLPHACVIQQ